MKNWLKRSWKYLLVGVIVIALLFGVMGMILERGIDRAIVPLWEENIQIWGENTLLWKENERLREELEGIRADLVRLPNLTVERGVRITGSDEWTDHFTAKTGQRLEFMVKINSDVVVHNVWIQADLPGLLVCKGGLKVDGVDFFGDITEGVNIGTVTFCKPRIVTWEAQIATASLFPVGTNTLIVPIEVRADCAEPRVGEITIIVNRSAPASSGGGYSRPPSPPDCPPGEPGPDPP